MGGTAKRGGRRVMPLDAPPMARRCAGAAALRRGAAGVRASDALSVAADPPVGALGGRRRHRRLAAAAGGAGLARSSARRCSSRTAAAPAARWPCRCCSRPQPDGYTIAQLPQPVFRVYLTQTVQWHPLRDVTEIIQISGVTFGLLVKADSPLHAPGRPVRVRARGARHAVHRHQRRRHHRRTWCSRSCSARAACATSTCPTRAWPSRSTPSAPGT